jgi:hypothetical protein
MKTGAQKTKNKQETTRSGDQGNRRSGDQKIKNKQEIRRSGEPLSKKDLLIS